MISLASQQQPQSLDLLIVVASCRQEGRYECNCATHYPLDLRDCRLYCLLPLSLGLARSLRNQATEFKSLDRSVCITRNCQHQPHLWHVAFELFRREGSGQLLKVRALGLIPMDVKGGHHLIT